MKNYLLFIFILITSITVTAQKNEVTTYYLIRHAEKVRTDSTNKNPDLNKKGMDRAKKWSTVFENVDFDIIYSTNYNRTIQTATPTAKKKNLELQFYDPQKMYDEAFRIHTKGKTVLIVGHSNTTPKFVNKILGQEKYPQIEDSNNANLYIISIIKSETNDILLKIE